jgi:putative oxidoreductase
VAAMAMGLTGKDLGLVPVRMSIGATMLYHGTKKLRGDGAAQTAAFFEQLGFRPGRTWGALAGLAEVVAGATTLLGIGTRIGALAVIATQGMAIAKVHRGKGFDSTAGGWEFNALLVAAAIGLLVSGPGTASVHEAVERRLQGGARWLFQPRRRAGVRFAKLLK